MPTITWTKSNVLCNGIMCLKEFVATFVFLITYSRLGSYDLFSSSLILYMIMVVFAFPFMSIYIFACLRLGPWFKKDSLILICIQLSCVLISQILGTLAAAGFQLHIRKWYGDAGYFDAAANRTVTGVVFIDSKNDEPATALFDEFFAVLVLLIGLMHLIEAIEPKFFANAYWTENPKVTVKLEDVERPPKSQDIFTRKPVLPPLSQPPQEPPPPLLKQYTPIPIYLILNVCVLVAAVIRGFPSAHQSMHISLFIAWTIDNGTAWRFGTRIVGGICATACAIAYYHIMYYYAAKPSKSQWLPNLKQLIVDPPPVFMNSQLLTIPFHMRRSNGKLPSMY